MALAIDGSGTGTATNTSGYTLSGTLTTAVGFDIIVAAISMSATVPWPAIYSVVDSAGLSWIRRNVVQVQNGSQYQVLEYWYAQAPGAPLLSAATLTLTLSTTCDSVASIWFGISGYGAGNINHPIFDTSTTIPAIATGTSSAPSITFSSVATAGMSLGLYGGTTDVTAAGTGYTLIGHATVTGSSFTTSVAAQDLVFASAQTNTANAFGTSSTSWVEGIDTFVTNTSGSGSGITVPGTGISLSGRLIRRYPAFGFQDY